MKLLKSKVIETFFNPKFLKFALFGSMGYIISMAIIIISKEVFHIHHLIAWQVAWFLTNFFTFYFNKYYTFKSKSLFWKELWRYYLVNSSTLFIATVSVFILVDVFKVWYVTASIIASFFLMFYSYVLHKLWSFKAR